MSSLWQTWLLAITFRKLSSCSTRILFPFSVSKRLANWAMYWQGADLSALPDWAETDPWLTLDGLTRRRLWYLNQQLSFLLIAEQNSISPLSNSLPLSSPPFPHFCVNELRSRKISLRFANVTKKITQRRSPEFIFDVNESIRKERKLKLS